jgi:adenine-specific DNA-methyltransferase
MNQVFQKAGDDTFLRVMPNTANSTVISMIDSLHGTFSERGYGISTGPVVSFRMKDFLTFAPNQSAIPLITIHDIKPYAITHRGNPKKPGFFRITQNNRMWITPNSNYVLLRRFTAKEENRRLTAAPFTQSTFTSSQIALENHLNYIYLPNEKLSEDEMWGLTALFNSSQYDTYFRSISGSTQVNASEVKHMKIPSRDAIQQLGKRIRNSTSPAKDTDALVDEVLGKCENN